MCASKITLAAVLAAPVTALAFAGIYKLYPPVPIRENDACTGHQIGVDYVLHLDSARQVTGTPIAAMECIELNCNTNTPSSRAPGSSPSPTSTAFTRRAARFCRLRIRKHRL